uniref:NADH-ubiquinone oxidoreductase chain 3 n=1 Tax=Laeonereis culveri TaxID=1859080 RepID=A0A1B0ZF15_9ANNE|nr:NADH dehydrogenase subunit 3 [Laeonereis culveri]
MIMSMMIALFFPMLILMLTLFMSKKSQINYEKSTPFECGFDPMNSARIPFSMRFFILAVLFLVFDIEIALLMPLPSIMYMSMKMKMSAMLFCFILILGLFHEWNEGSLEWK